MPFERVASATVVCIAHDWFLRLSCRRLEAPNAAVVSDSLARSQYRRTLQDHGHTIIALCGLPVNLPAFIGTKLYCLVKETTCLRHLCSITLAGRRTGHMIQ